MYGTEAPANAIAYEYNAAFAPVMQREMEAVNGDNDEYKNDAVVAVQQEISAAKNVMVQNIDKVLERGERIELLVDKTERLDHNAVRFKKQAVNLKRSMWWKRVKMGIVLFLVVLLVVYGILALSCGGLLLDKCLK